GAALSGAIRIYLMRYRRRTHRLRLREAPPLSSDLDPRGWSEPRSNETAISVRSLEKLLPGTEARVLRQLAARATWAGAAAAGGRRGRAAQADGRPGPLGLCARQPVRRATRTLHFKKDGCALVLS